MKKLLIVLIVFGGFFGFHFLNKTENSAPSPSPAAEGIDHAESKQTTALGDTVIPEKAGGQASASEGQTAEVTKNSKANESENLLEQKMIDAKRKIEIDFAQILRRFESRITGPGQVQCVVNLCSIRLPVDPRNETLRAEILREVRSKVMEAIRATPQLIKAGTSNNNQADTVVGEVEFYESPDEQKKSEEQVKEYRSSILELLNPAAFLEYKKAQRGVEPMKVVVQYLLLELQQNNQLVTVIKVDSDCSDPNLCKFTVHHTSSTWEAQSADVELLSGAIQVSDDVLQHGFVIQTLANTPKDGMTWFTVRASKK